MDTTQKTYDELVKSSKKITVLHSIMHLLEWDQETYMPEEGATVRTEQLELIASLVHKEKSSRRLGKIIGKLIDLETGSYLATGLNRFQKAALRQWRRDYLQAACLPTAFVKKFARLSCESMGIWAAAREKNNFNQFAPYLRQIVEMSREKADLLGYQEHPYDALLDQYEPGMKTKQIEILFKELGEKVTDLLNKILKKPQVNDAFLFGSFSKEKQLEFSDIILKTIGFDLKKGRLDISNHPFSMSLHPNDSRITTRIHPSSLMDCFSAVLHEAGHSFYDMGMSVHHFGTPLCEYISLGIHESQSRLWETRIGQSRAFWKYFLPIIKKTFDGHLNEIPLDQFYKAINKVAPRPIRIEADEVTYPLHIIVRFEIEKKLIEGTLNVEEIPQAWNERMQKYLSITPKNDSEGCLQDIHWSMGAFGYFPTYNIGNLYSLQFFEQIEKSHPDWEKRFASGDFLFIKDWLQENIHIHGKYYSAQDLCKHITGKTLHSEPYLKYLTAKYSSIYNFH